ncbi:MAG: hypothetical protein WC788_08175 [Candidatus Paceibacterota bacterium]|jgi:hypothetical protein
MILEILIGLLAFSHICTIVLLKCARERLDIHARRLSALDRSEILYCKFRDSQSKDIFREIEVIKSHMEATANQISSIIKLGRTTDDNLEKIEDKFKNFTRETNARHSAMLKALNLEEKKSVMTTDIPWISIASITIKKQK